ncbi:acyltransferase [Mesobacillus foraminis]|uniref:acyltransferase n=1 Tax=Mesobacillus foraminis TaxID=279826 RepID=UPI0039A3B4D6
MLIKYLKKLKRNYIINKLRSKGMDIASDCQLTGKIKFGSEPYLISIKEKVTIADGAVLLTHDGGSRVIREKQNDKLLINYGKIIIKQNCFIGHSAIILPGVSVGPNSIVAAGAVVTKDVPPNTVYGGVPAKKICSLDDYYLRLKCKVPIYDPENFRNNKKEEILSKLQ